MNLPISSHTFLNDWDNCPHKAFRKFIKKDLPKGPQTDAMKWGNEVHSAFEVRIKHGTAFPKEMEKYEKLAAPLIAAGAEAEKALAIDKDGSPVDFWNKGAWLRGKLDAAMIRWDHQTGNHCAAIFDWKTGKRREDPTELKTHAVLLRAMHPSLTKITACYVWLQDNEVGKPHDVTDTETHLAEIQKTMATVENCLEIDNFPKRPNPLCGGHWGSCPVEDCEFRRGV